MIIKVDLGAQSYDIVLQAGALAQAAEWMDLDRKVLVVTDDGVPAAYAAAVAARCREPVVVTLPHGEATKCFDQFRHLLAVMLQAGFTRRDCVVAVGGGVVGDLSGFTASCYMRGVDFYNIPTTLLSQVDSSIGGKTAIDFQGVKNIVGAFYQPKKVIVDPDTLSTLDARQLHAGLAEAIKMALTSDRELFELIESSTDLRADLPEIIRRSLCIKRDVVEQDPKESGLRRILNFGHTVGHAIESEREGSLLHGECVALGMLPLCSDEVRARLLPVLRKYGLPTDLPRDTAGLSPYLLHDKKKQAAAITAVWVDEVGTCRLIPMSPEEILGRLEATV